MHKWNVIAALRDRRRLTQAELVKALKPALSLRQLQGYEAGDRPVSPSHAEALAEFFGVEANYLLDHAALAGRIKHYLAESELRDLTEAERSVFPEDLIALLSNWFAYRKRANDIAGQLQAAQDRLTSISEKVQAEDGRQFEEIMSIGPGTPNLHQRFAEVERAREALKPLRQTQRELERLVIELGVRLQRESLQGPPIAAQIDHYVVTNYGPY